MGTRAFKRLANGFEFSPRKEKVPDSVIKEQPKSTLIEVIERAETYFARGRGIRLTLDELKDFVK